jgi:16S rRNA (cytosine967-C5)-methyltransferase
MREENQLRIILDIIDSYKLDEPLYRYLKRYYKQHPQMGSKDRSNASAFVYNYFRMGTALKNGHPIERLILGSFLSNEAASPLLKYCLENFSDIKEDELHLPLTEKEKIARTIAPDFNIHDIFPYGSELSDKIDIVEYAESFFRRPELWIRARKQKLKIVESELKQHKLPFKQDKENPCSIFLPNGTPVTQLLSYEKGYFEVQDWSSQQTINFIPVQKKDTWWDACAGSGGKSLMIYDKEPSVEIFATDVRASIIENLHDRFRKVGLKKYYALEMDLTHEISVEGLPFEKENLSGIVADVPCSGSGTWARTPEWISMFDMKQVDEFQNTQRRIISNLAPILEPGKSLVYITCSVFKKENEDNIEYFLKDLPLELAEAGYLNGIKRGSDVLYAARLIRK